MRLSASRDTVSRRRPVITRSTGAASSSLSHSAMMRACTAAAFFERDGSWRMASTSPCLSSRRGCGARCSKSRLCAGAVVMAARQSNIAIVRSRFISGDCFTHKSSAFFRNGQTGRPAGAVVRPLWRRGSGRSGAGRQTICAAGDKLALGVAGRVRVSMPKSLLAHELFV